jgi:hypothetical protein
MAFENSPGGQALKKYGGRGASSGNDTPVTDGRGYVLRDGAFVDPDAPRVGGGRRGGGGGAAAREEADAVQNLIEKLQREMDLSREMDPIAKEMIRYREQLKDATAEERAEVEALITQREREKAALEGMSFVAEATGDALVDALMGGADAGERLIDTLKRAVLQAVLLGNGPLGGMFGGGLLKGLFSAAVPGFAGGGWTGAGGTSDVAGVVHAEEYVFDADATRRIGVANLEALRRAGRRGYRDGGYVAGSRPPAFRAPGAGSAAGQAAQAERVVFEINVRGTGNAEIQAGVQQAIAAAFDEHVNHQFPGLVKIHMNDRWGM